MSFADDLLAIGRDAGLDAVGIAPATPFESTRRDLEERKAAGLHGGMSFTYRRPDRSTDPSYALPGARSLIVGARSYRRALPSPPEDGRAVGRVAMYSWRDHYEPLRSALSAVASALTAAGHRARVLFDSNFLVDREAAYRASLGWYGKNANLLLPGHGSWFVLGSVVTDADLAPTSAEPIADGCGSCTRCIPACPTDAIVAPGVVDARRCLAWLVEAPGSFPVELRAALGDRIYGCDACQEVCPPNRVEDRRDPPASEEGSEAWVPLVELLSLSDDELLDRFGRWYIPRRDPRYVRRNALVALGNVGDPVDAEVVATVRRWASCDDPLLREHAEWAADRLGLRDPVP